VAGLYFGNDDKEAMLHMKNYMERVYTDAYGDGESGLFFYLRALRVIFKEREDQDDKRHKSNSMKLNLLITIATIIGVVIAATAIFVTVSLSRRSSADPFSIFGPDKQSLTYTSYDSPPQDAKTPNLE
jgi:hypothetical protein